MFTFSAPLALALTGPGASKRHSNRDRHGVGGYRTLSGASKRLSNRIELGSRRGDRCRSSGGDHRNQGSLRRGGRPLRRPRRPLRRRNHGRLRVGKRLGDTSNKHCSNTRGTTMFKGEFPAPNPRPPAPGPRPRAGRNDISDTSERTINNYTSESKSVRIVLDGSFRVRLGARMVELRSG